MLLDHYREIDDCEQAEKEAEKDWEAYQYIDENSESLMMKTSFEMLLNSISEMSKDIK